MMMVLGIGIAYLVWRGVSADIVIDVGDDMPQFLSDAIRSANLLPYRIPIRNILTSLVTHGEENQMPRWFDIYVTNK